MEFMGIENGLKYEDLLLEFVYIIYRSTRGRYPKMEWLKEKPHYEDREGFANAYRDFLHHRLAREFDELYFIEENGELIGTFAIVYRFDGKRIPWIEKDFHEKCAFLEFLMVHPSRRGMGIGKKAVAFSAGMARKHGLDLCVVTFEDLEAYQYYLKIGFEVIYKKPPFITLRYNPTHTKTSDLKGK